MVSSRLVPNSLRSSCGSWRSSSAADVFAAHSSVPNRITSTLGRSSVQLFSAFRWIIPSCPRKGFAVVKNVSISCLRSLLARCLLQLLLLGRDHLFEDGVQPARNLPVR